MESPFFSIIVPVYKVESYIDKCIQSILNQSYQDFELILVDDGSPDNCPQICDDYVSKYHNIRCIHQKNRGLSGARNTGLSVAKGDYILFIDSDDYFSNNTCFESIHSVAVSGDIDIILHGCIIHDLSSGKERISRGNYDISILKEAKKEVALCYLFDHGLFPGAAWIMTVKRKLIEETKLVFPLNVTAEDYYWNSSILHAANTIDATNKAFVTYNINREGSITTQSKISGIKGVLYSIDNWLNINLQENGITNYLAQAYLLSLMAYTHLPEQEKVDIKDDLFFYSTILNKSSKLHFKLARLILKIFGVQHMGLFIEKIYHLISKR